MSGLLGALPIVTAGQTLPVPRHSKCVSHVCVTTETRHLDRLGQLGELEHVCRMCVHAFRRAASVVETVSASKRRLPSLLCKRQLQVGARVLLATCVLCDA